MQGSGIGRLSTPTRGVPDSNSKRASAEKGIPPSAVYQLKQSLQPITVSPYGNALLLPIKNLFMRPAWKKSRPITGQASCCTAGPSSAPTTPASGGERGSLGLWLRLPLYPKGTTNWHWTEPLRSSFKSRPAWRQASRYALAYGPWRSARRSGERDLQLPRRCRAWGPGRYRGRAQ